MEKTLRRRIHLMDEIRGFAVFCMVFYHAFYSIAFLFHTGWMAQVFYFFMPVEPLFAAAFIFISGISSRLSRSNLRRGGKLLLIALGVTAVTLLVIPQAAIQFGVLHLLSVCMLLFGFTQKKLTKVPLWVGMCVCALGFLLSCGIVFSQVPYLGLPGVPSLQISTMGEGVFHQWGFALGFRTPNFASSDYFPLLPWIFVFFAGTFCGRFAEQGKFPAFCYRSRVPFFSFLGRHALIIYVVHQPLIYAIMMLIQLF